jgi:hypothetical protein
MKALKALLLVCLLTLSAQAGQLMPWDTEVTVTAKLVVFRGFEQALKFSPPLDFKYVPETISLWT